MFQYLFNETVRNRSEFAYEKDGSLKLYLSGTLPEGVPKSNWLPAPEGGNLFSMTMRLYVPKAEVLSGGYYPPPIKKVTWPPLSQARTVPKTITGRKTLALTVTIY